MSFHTLVTGAFDFLVTTYGFQWTAAPEIAGAVECRKEPIGIHFLWGKGEIDIDFQLSMDFAAGHKVFRPYISRTFALGELAVRHDPNAFASLRARSECKSAIISVDQARVFLDECALVMQQHCVEILQGDLTVLEEITRERRASG